MISATLARQFAGRVCSAAKRIVVKTVYTRRTKRGVVCGFSKFRNLDLQAYSSFHMGFRFSRNAFNPS